MDGEPARLRDIKSWAQDSELKEALGDYISAKDIHGQIGIEYATMHIPD